MIKIKKTLMTLGAFATVASINPLALLAQDTIRIVPTGNFVGLDAFLPSQFVSTAINLLLAVSGVVAFFFLLWGGIQWILAGGDKEGTEKARKRITASLVGLAIVFSAYALLFIIKTLFGINVIEVPIKKIGA